MFDMHDDEPIRPDSFEGFETKLLKRPFVRARRNESSTSLQHREKWRSGRYHPGGFQWFLTLANVQQRN